MNKIYIILPLSVFVLLVLVRVFNISYPIDLRVMNSNVTSEMAVVGDGKVDIVPDTTVIDAGITVSGARTAQEAQDKMTAVNNKIIENVKALGVKKEDITTSNFSVNPEYNYGIGAPVPLDKPVVQTMPVEPNQGSNSKISGYNGNATVTIKIRDKNLVSQVIQKVSEAGANNVGSPRFTVEDTNKYREEARNKAIENAKLQAQKLAKQLGIRLGGITNMVEGKQQPYPMYDMKVMGAPAAGAQSAPPSIEPGQQSVTSTVTLYFERK